MRHTIALFALLCCSCATALPELGRDLTVASTAYNDLCGPESERDLAILAQVAAVHPELKLTDVISKIDVLRATRCPQLKAALNTAIQGYNAANGVAKDVQ
jgi:hypothetical protein